jgi:hypothetical protein
MKPGKTGQFPRGRIDATDDGELRMAIAADHGNAIVRIDFGTPTAWIGLPAKEARELAVLLRQKADELEARKQ